jgi:hypothetical protein
LPGAGGSPPISADAIFCLCGGLFELFLRPLLISLRRVFGCPNEVALDARFVGGILLAFVIALRERSSLGANQQGKGDAK